MCTSNLLESKLTYSQTIKKEKPQQKHTSLCTIQYNTIWNIYPYKADRGVSLICCTEPETEKNNEKVKKRNGVT